MKTLSIHLGTPYPIYIGHHLLDTDLLKICCIKLNKRIVMITDSQLHHWLGKDLQHRLQEQGLAVELLSFPAGEHYKTRETKQTLEDALLLKHYGRDTCLIALGGGVTTDLVGFLAATYCRGIPVIYIPTTLLAMVDASIGGKTCVNTPHGKNLIGTFTQPHAVFMDTHILNTLPKNEWHNGMAEMIKHSVIADLKLFDILQKKSDLLQNHHSDFLIDMIYASCLIKKNIVEQDEHEQGIRQILNFGHTIGHAIEIIERYHIDHGEAVAIGMLVESYLSIQCGYLQKNNLITIENILRDYGLPLQTSAFQDKKSFQKILMLDKKSVQNIPRFVLLDQIGKPHRDQGRYTMAVDPIHLNQTLDWAAGFFCHKGV
jgi:3-dehydroquinate synthase